MNYLGRVCVLNYSHFNRHDNNFHQHDFPGWQQDYFGPPPAGAFPMGPPPAFSPPIPAWQVGPSGVSSCLYRNTYIWLRNGRSFWFFPTSVDRHSIRGFRWRSRSGWTNSVLDPNEIRSFQCF